MKPIPFNINSYVRIRLTEKGKHHLRLEYDDLVKPYGTPPPFKFELPKEDANGWSAWQLWEVMQRFGSAIWNGCDMPFGADILFEVDDKLVPVCVDPVVEAVRTKLLQRSDAGRKKYGVGLDRTDLTYHDWLVHLQEELLDAAGYVERQIQEVGWRPMDTAPKQGVILLKMRMENMISHQTAEWSSRGEWIESYCGERITHFEILGWRPVEP